jgi:hypothetical protein
MPWVKITDTFDDDVDLETMSAEAVALFLCGTTYCARKLTDGFIPKARAERLPFSSKQAISMLCEGKNPWWVKVEGGYQVRSYLRYNPTKERVLADRAAGAERVRRMRGGQNDDVTPLHTPLRTPLVTGGVTPTSHIPYPISHIPEEIDISSQDSQAAPVPVADIAIDIKPPKKPRPDISWFDPWFEQFKAAYPKRHGNNWKQAGIKLKRLFEGSIPPDPKEVLAGAVAYAKTNPEPNFTAHVTTWVNQSRWCADYTQVAHTPTKPGDKFKTWTPEDLAEMGGE